MAGIDKTYTDNYEEYKVFKDWADGQVVTFFDGSKECVGDWVWHLEEKDFETGEIPIMNTPVWLDIYLIQNCNFQFVIDRMKEVYSRNFSQFKTVKRLNEIPEGYEKNRRIVIKNGDRCKFPFYKNMFEKPVSTKSWWLQCRSDFCYNTKTKTWAHNSAFYPTNSNTALLKSIKAVVRHLRKQYLPKGINFELSGEYGENYLITVC